MLLRTVPLSEGLLHSLKSMGELPRDRQLVGPYKLFNPPVGSLFAPETRLLQNDHMAA